MMEPIVGHNYRFKNGSVMCITEIRKSQDGTRIAWINVCYFNNNLGSLMSPAYFQSLVVEDLTKKIELEAEQLRMHESMHSLDWVRV